jgi:WD40 repeat protein
VASKELLVDLYHTLRQYYSPIRDSAAHVYHSALATMPSCRLYELNSHEMGDTVICKPRRTVFVPGVMYMQDGSTSTTTLALSSDGSQVAFYCPIILSVGSTNSGDTSFKFGTESAGFISALQFSPDGHRLLCADNRGRLHSKELDDGHLWSYLPAADPIEGTWTVSSAAFSSNGQYCVFNLITKPDLTNSESPKFISSPSIRLVMRRLEFGAKHHVLHDSSEGLQHSSNAIFTPDAHYVIQAYGNVMSVWNVARHVLHTRVESSEAGLNSLSDIRALAAVSNTTYASLTSGGTITIWDLVQGTHLRTFSVVDFTASLTVAGLASSSDGSLLGVVVDNIVKIVSAADGQLVAQHTLPRRRGRHFGIAFIIFDDTKFRVVVAFPQHPVFVWSYKLARQSHMETSTTLADTRVSCTSFSADGSLVVSGAEDGSMTIWKCDTGLPTTQYAGKGAAIAASFSAPNPRFVLSVRVAGIYLFSPFVLQVDDTQTGDTLRPSKYSSNLETYTATLSPDEKYLAMRFKPLSAYQPGNQGGIIILILDIQTGETVASSLDLQEGISTSNTYIVSYTPDGLIPVQDAVNESLIVRDAQTLDVRHILRHSDAYIFGYTMLSPCSTRVARISHGGGHVRVWSLESGADLFTAYIGKADHAKPWELLMPVWTHSGLMYASSQSLSTWSFDESKSVVVHMWPTESTPRSLYMSQDLSYLYAWCEDHHIRVWAIAHGFDMLEPILKLDASPWPETVKRALWWRHLMIASHNDTELRAVVRHGQHHLFVVINLDDGVCVRVTPFGDGQELDDRIPMAIVSNRLYMRYPEGDIGYLAKRLAQIPFDEDTDAAQWLKTVSDTCETLQRALWQVWNVETGEMEAIITASGTTMKLEALPPSFPLRQSHPEGDEEHALLQIYDYSTARLRIYSGSPLKQVYSLGIPSDRRPAIDVGSQTIATHGSCVAMGSKHGTVSILDFSKAVKAAEARGMMSPQSSTVWTDIS